MLVVLGGGGGGDNLGSRLSTWANAAHRRGSPR